MSRAKVICTKCLIVFTIGQLYHGADYASEGCLVMEERFASSYVLGHRSYPIEVNTQPNQMLVTVGCKYVVTSIEIGAINLSTTPIVQLVFDYACSLVHLQMYLLCISRRIAFAAG